MNSVDELNFLLGIGPPRPLLPEALQRAGYTGVRTLGKGSFGQALLLFHKGKGQYFVAKHMNMSAMNARQRKDAHNEIAVLQQLNHPNIVRYVECFEDFPHLYIVMEYADGGDLYTHLNNLNKTSPLSRRRLTDAETVTLTEAQVVSLFVQTVMAVKYMHDRRLLHRDIKSQNVFLTKSHVVKLGDFGITTMLQNTIAMANTLCGTPCYFSPELCEGKPYNNKSDIWALGVLLYELCTCRLPFESTAMKALMHEIIHKEPRRIPSSFSDDIWQLIRRMLQKDPALRPDAGQVLLTPVLMRRVPDIIAQLRISDASSSQLTPAPAPPSPPSPPARACRRPSALQPAPLAAAARPTAAQTPVATKRKVSPADASPQSNADKEDKEPKGTKKPVKGDPADSSQAPSRPSIAELLARFDREKRRIAEERQGGNDDGGSTATNGGVASRVGRATPPSPQETPVMLAEAGPCSRSGDHDNKDNVSGKDNTQEQLNAVLLEMTSHFTHFQYTLRPAEDTDEVAPTLQETVAAADYAKPPLACRDESVNIVTPVSFADPAGVRLDVDELRQAPTPELTGAASPNVNADDVAMAARDEGRRTVNLKFHATRNPHSSKSGPTPVTEKATNATPTHDDVTQTAEDCSLTGECLCGHVCTRHSLSSVYGSFICRCDVCCRTSGSSAGVEWLHLPDATHFADVLDDLRASDAASLAAGAGTTAAMALRPRRDGSASSEGTKPQRPAPSSRLVGHCRTYTFTTVARGRSEGGTGTETETRPGHYTMYFCDTCGCTVGMQHDNIEGVLLTKTILDATSIATLARFAHSVLSVTQ